MNAPTQATPATVSDTPTHEQQVRELLAMFNHDHVSTFSLTTDAFTALFAEWDAERSAYHRLRDEHAALCEVLQPLLEETQRMIHTPGRGPGGLQRPLSNVVAALAAMLSATTGAADGD